MTIELTQLQPRLKRRRTRPTPSCQFWKPRWIYRLRSASAPSHLGSRGRGSRRRGQRTIWVLATTNREEDSMPTSSWAWVSTSKQRATRSFPQPSHARTFCPMRPGSIIKCLRGSKRKTKCLGLVIMDRLRGMRALTIPGLKDLITCVMQKIDK